jgi:Fic family protein
MKPYTPEALPLNDLDPSKLITSVSEASAALATYNGLLQAMINPAVMLSPLTNQEAVLSSRIEGTQATVEEVLEHEAGQRYEEQKERDIQEILNYRKAMALAREWLAERRPITLGLICALHEILMDSVRGQGKEPGQFRKDQNWIGPPGCLIEQATFVPPNPLQLRDHLEALEAYLRFDDFEPLSQTAIVHAQFELLHPFKDGNGRIGRLLIPLYLYSKGRLSAPMFYLSSYLEAHREEYYVRLRAISTERDWIGWITFFLNALIYQARDNHNRIREIMALHEEMKQQVHHLTRSQHSAQIVDALFDRPIFRVSDFMERTGIPKPSVHPLIRQLIKAGILTILRKPSGSKPAILAFPQLLNAAEGRIVIPDA